MISRSDLFLHPSLKILEEKALRSLLMAAIKRCGSREAAIRTLGWNRDQAQKLLEAGAVADYPGPMVLSLSLDDICGLSLFEVRKRVRRKLLGEVLHLGSGYDVAYFLDVEEWDVRRGKN